MLTVTAQMDKRGCLVLPAKLRKALGIKGDSLFLLETADDGSFRARPAVVVPVEKYTDARKAEFLLNGAVDEQDYKRAVEEVWAVGLDPARIPHEPPPGTAKC